MEYYNNQAITVSSFAINKSERIVVDTLLGTNIFSVEVVFDFIFVSYKVKAGNSIFFPAFLSCVAKSLSDKSSGIFTEVKIY